MVKSPPSVWGDLGKIRTRLSDFHSYSLFIIFMSVRSVLIILSFLMLIICALFFLSSLIKYQFFCSLERNKSGVINYLYCVSVLTTFISALTFVFDPYSPPWYPRVSVGTPSVAKIPWMLKSLIVRA